MKDQFTSTLVEHKINRSSLQIRAKSLIEKECLREHFCENKSASEVAGLALIVADVISFTNS